MVASEAVEKQESEARVKAAAWAWYQRSGGSAAPSAGLSEAFASRCATRQCASRFQREAASRHRASLASTPSDSALTSFSSTDNSSSLTASSFRNGTDPDQSPNLVPDRIQFSNQNFCNTEHALHLVALDPAACWDCGSSLFDSFELVAMSKKLDAELQEPNIDVELMPQDLHPGSSLICHNQEVLPLCNTPHNPFSPPDSPPRPFDKLLSAPDMHSKQAVYDMLCQYGVASKLAKRETDKLSPAQAACGAEPTKHKPRLGRISLHSLAKALHHIRHSSPHWDSGGAVIQDHHHHNHPLHTPYRQGKALYVQGNGGHIGASKAQGGKSFLCDDATDKGHRKERHIHHHHHHHYHYLFHSDDDFHLQSLDKSLMVATAGLRRSGKVDPTFSSYLESPTRAELGMDHGRKWADFGSIPLSGGCNF